MPPSEPFVDPLDEEGPLRLPDPVPGVAPVKVIEHEQAARRHRTHAPLEPKVQVAVGACVVLGGLGAALASTHPTGGSVVDAVLTFGFAAAVILASSVARRWTWLVLSGTAVVLATPLPARLLAIVALLVAFHGAAIATKRSRISGAIVAALSMQGLLRAAHIGFHGSTALIVAAVTIPVLVSGYRASQRRTRQRARLGMKIAGAVVAVAVIGLGVAVFMARQSLQAAVSESHKGLDAALAGQQGEAAKQWGLATISFRDALAQPRPAVGQGRPAHPHRRPARQGGHRGLEVGRRHQPHRHRRRAHRALPRPPVRQRPDQRPAGPQDAAAGGRHRGGARAGQVVDRRHRHQVAAVAGGQPAHRVPQADQPGAARGRHGPPGPDGGTGAARRRRHPALPHPLLHPRRVRATWAGSSGRGPSSPRRTASSRSPATAGAASSTTPCRPTGPSSWASTSSWPATAASPPRASSRTSPRAPTSRPSTRWRRSSTRRRAGAKSTAPCTSTPSRWRRCSSSRARSTSTGSAIP